MTYQERIRELKLKRKIILQEYDKAIKAKSVNGCLNLRQKDDVIFANLKGLKAGYALRNTELIKAVNDKIEEIGKTGDIDSDYVFALKWVLEILKGDGK